MFRLLEESFRYEPFVTFGLAVFACYFALIALNVVYYYYLFHFLWFCSYAFIALVAFISFSSCCNPLRTFIVEQCLSLEPFFVSPLPPSLDYAFVASRYEEVSRLRRVLCKPPVVGKTREEPKSPIPYFKYNHDDWIRFHTPNGGAKNFYPVDVEVYETLEDLLRGIFPHRRNDDRKKSHSNRSPTVLPDAVDLLCEQFAAMDLGPSAQASAPVQHQDEPSSSMPVDINRDAVVQSWENEADADSLALNGTLSSSPTGTPFPDCDVEMDDSFVNDSNEIPSTAAGEIGPVAMDIGGDSLSMDSRVQELEHQHVQQESTVGFNITDAMHTAAALAFMPPAQEQSMPEENTPANGTDNYSDDFSLDIIADAAVAEASEHEQDVGDSTASDALATNMLPSLDQSNNTTVGNASSVDMSSDFSTMTNASTLVEDANDEGKALSFKLDFSKAAIFQPVKQRCATFVASLPIIEEEDDTYSEDEEVHVGADELAEGDASELIPAYQDPAVEPDSSVAAPSVRGVKRGLDTTDDSTFSTDKAEYAPVVRRRVDEGDSESLDSQDGQSDENGEAIVPIQDQNTTVPGPSVAAPSVRGVKRGLDTTEDTFSTDEAEYVSVRRRRVDEGDTNISINHGRSEEDRVGVDGHMNDDEAPALPPPQAAPLPEADDILAEILGDDDDDD